MSDKLVFSKINDTEKENIEGDTEQATFLPESLNQTLDNNTFNMSFVSCNPQEIDKMDTASNLNINNCDNLSDNNISKPCDSQSILKKVIMPKIIKKRGRPRGADLTVIGLSKKKRSNLKPIEYIKRNTKEKEEILLNLILNENAKYNKLVFVHNDKHKYLFDENDIVTTLPHPLYDEIVDIALIASYFDEKTLKKIHNILNSNEPIWLCNICDSLIETKEQCIRYLTQSEARKIRSKQGLSWTCESCNAIGNDINSLKAVIISLKDDLLELKSKNTMDKFSFEDVIYEIHEREKRKSNIVIFNVAESQSVTTANKIKDDKATTENILTNLSININIGDCNRHKKLSSTLKSTAVLTTRAMCLVVDRSVLSSAINENFFLQ
ncbi:unnamed protein product [Brassicogethes aeneus]|uniref:Uncharacterized protein n=1 Tax=Brassicogethes aeneus TaxID=1431903 RepID=A0A9P0FMB5_BRAAE|nr:unnamed protein product [Brassicogethes aeneus]